MSCRPLDSYAEALHFLERPPGWAALCVPWAGGPGADTLLRNSEAPAPHYCHYAPDTEPELARRRALPRALLCHDMANGYHDDSYIEGTENSEAYNFYDWAGIDIFCYFSHHFITIPPLAWINVAHRHGVKVLGTIITEWAEGAILWNKILATPERYIQFADTLVAIAKYLKFEGWLLNIENKIGRPHVLVEFVRYFHEQLHLEIPGAVLIWYDSVTINGELVWQNALTEKNIDFFRVCDGIFTNYSWTEADVANSVILAATEDDRVHDVYIGIDVWGRNFYGGGQFNTAEAVKVVHRNGCSLAIFAPAWTHEAIDEYQLYPKLGEKLTTGEHKPFFQQYLLRDKALWDSLWPYLNTRVPVQLPFRTSFCRGQGPMKRLLGQIVGANPWYNLREMEYQPNASHGPHGYRIVKDQNIYAKSCVSVEKTNTKTIMISQISEHNVEIPKIDPISKNISHDSKNLTESNASRAVTDSHTTKNATENYASQAESESNATKNVTENNVSKAVTETHTTKNVTESDVSKTVTESHATENVSENDVSKNVTGFNIIKNKKKAKFVDKLKNVFNRTFKKRRHLESEPTAVPITEIVDNSTEQVLRIETDENEASKRDGENDEDTENLDENDDENTILAQKIDPDKIDKALSTVERVKSYAKLVAKSLSTLDVVKSNTEFTQTSLSTLDRAKSDAKMADKSEQAILTSERVLSHEEMADKTPKAISATAVSTVAGQVCIQLKPKADRTKYNLVIVADERACLEYYSEDSFNGGSCLIVHPSDLNTTTMEGRTIRLFHCEFACENNLIFYTVTKTLEGHDDQSLNIICSMTDRAKKRFKVILLGTDVQVPQKHVSTQTHCIRYGVQHDRFPATGEQLKDVQKFLLGQRQDFYVPTEDVNRWKVRYYVIDFAGSTLTSISCQTGVPQGAILLGQIGICPQ